MTTLTNINKGSSASLTNINSNLAVRTDSRLQEYSIVKFRLLESGKKRLMESSPISASPSIDKNSGTITNINKS